MYIYIYVGTYKAVRTNVWNERRKCCSVCICAQSVHLRSRLARQRLKRARELNTIMFVSVLVRLGVLRLSAGMEQEARRTHALTHTHTLTEKRVSTIHIQNARIEHASYLFIVYTPRTQSGVSACGWPNTIHNETDTRRRRRRFRPSDRQAHIREAATAQHSYNIHK